MKKILIVLAATLMIGCSKSTNNPTPIVATTNAVSSKTSYDFNGNWDCYNWVVNDVTGQTHHRRFILSNQDSNSVRLSLNDYLANGTFSQIITMTQALVDSNYFDSANNTSQNYFKGVLTTDTTLMVYQYSIGNLGAIDTVQTKEFKKE